ncbi:zinc ribbon domain-containing protein [Peribacillus sp. NPDC055009]
MIIMKDRRKKEKTLYSIHVEWGMFRQFLAYKCELNGGRLVKVKPHFFHLCSASSINWLVV